MSINLPMPLYNERGLDFDFSTAIDEAWETVTAGSKTETPKHAVDKTKRYAKEKWYKTHRSQRGWGEAGLDFIATLFQVNRNQYSYGLINYSPVNWNFIINSGNTIVTDSHNSRSRGSDRSEKGEGKEKEDKGASDAVRIALGIASVIAILVGSRYLGGFCRNYSMTLEKDRKFSDAQRTIEELSNGDVNERTQVITNTHTLFKEARARLDVDKSYYWHVSAATLAGIASASLTLCGSLANSKRALKCGVAGFVFSAAYGLFMANYHQSKNKADYFNQRLPGGPESLKGHFGRERSNILSEIQEIESEKRSHSTPSFSYREKDSQSNDDVYSSKRKEDPKTRSYSPPPQANYPEYPPPTFRDTYDHTYTSVYTSASEFSYSTPPDIREIPPLPGGVQFIPGQSWTQDFSCDHGAYTMPVKTAKGIEGTLRCEQLEGSFCYAVEFGVDGYGPVRFFHKPDGAWVSNLMNGDKYFVWKTSEEKPAMHLYRR